MRSLALSVAAVLSCGVVALGCGAHRSHAETAAALKSGDPGERRSAADDLRDDGGPTPDATRALLEAIKTETDDKAYGAMLISLGASGSPDAEPYICAKVYAPDARMRTYAKKAHKLYLERNPTSKGCPPPGAAAAAEPTAVSTTNAPGAAPAPSGANGVPIGPASK